MKHTKEEILNALQIIKETCAEATDQYKDCCLCPFNDGDGHCTFNEQFPLSWDIKDEEPWMAFE